MYLTGKRTVGFDDQAACAVLGRLGSFNLIFFPNSTLSRSPHIHNFYEDYDEDWKSLLINFKAACNPRDPKSARTFIESRANNAAGLTAENLHAINAAFNVRLAVFAAEVAPKVRTEENAAVELRDDNLNDVQKAALRARIIAMVNSKRVHFEGMSNARTH